LLTIFPKDFLKIVWPVCEYVASQRRTEFLAFPFTRSQFISDVAATVKGENVGS